MNNYKEINFLLLRAIMGMNMTIHGAVRIFGNYADFLTRMQKMFAPTIIPDSLITIGAHLISPLELLFGLLLLIGLKTRLSILILNLNMMLLITGVCLLQKWELAGLQMAYALFLFFIGHFIELNKFSIDYLLTKKGK